MLRSLPLVAVALLIASVASGCGSYAYRGRARVGYAQPVVVAGPTYRAQPAYRGDPRYGRRDVVVTPPPARGGVYVTAPRASGRVVVTPPRGGTVVVTPPR